MNMLSHYLVIDTETTGKNSFDQIVELAIIDDTGSCLYQSLFKPDVGFNPVARSINKISDEELIDAPRFIDEWPRIKQILNRRVVVGHNIINFDLRLLKQTLNAQGEEFNLYSLPFISIDTLRLVKALGFKKHSQQSLAEHYHLSDETHRAKDDALQLLSIINCLEQEYPFDVRKYFYNEFGDQFTL